MQRRKFIIGAGALASGSAAAVGTGAFSNAAVERTVTVETEGDDAALLGFEEGESYDGVELNNTDGAIEIEFTDVNEEAVFQFEEFLKITNNGSEDHSIFVEKDSSTDGDEDMIQDVGGGGGNIDEGPLNFYVNGETIIGGNTHQADTTLDLDSGESGYVSVEVDTRLGDLPQSGSIVFSTTNENEFQGDI